nr:MAG TPA: hypothetical protein [Caudoviricetes sp.]DAY57380.1 MAG TPA: hypothetical protein [Caudoviricetes sp.]
MHKKSYDNIKGNRLRMERCANAEICAEQKET